MTDSPIRSRSPRLHSIMSSELHRLPQPDRIGLQHLRNQIDLLTQWRQITFMAENILLVNQRMTDLTTDHPETNRFMVDFNTLAADMTKTLDVSFAQCQQATDSLHYLIESLGKHRDGTPFGSPRRHQSPLLMSGANFFFCVCFAH